MSLDKRHRKQIKIGLTIKEKPRKTQKPTQNIVFQIKTTRQTEKNKQRKINKKATTTSTTISKQPSAPGRFPKIVKPFLN